MSVYTPIQHHELVEFLRSYTVGGLLAYQGIGAGIENTNYFVTTTAGRFVLTVFESRSGGELPYFLELMAFLAKHDVPGAHPLPDRDGRYLRTLKDKPAALFHRLSGAPVEQPRPGQVGALGAVLGQMHAVGRAFPGWRDNDRGPRWWHKMVTQLQPRLDPAEHEILREELRFQSLSRHTDLPQGVIHADLFRDNAVWAGDRLSGIIDFYCACNDVLLYDIAVAVNDWCSRENGGLDDERVLALLEAYHRQRPLTPQEQGAWPVMLRAGALRFWLSRLHDLHFPRPGEITHSKDPDVFKRILVERIEHHAHLRTLWVEHDPHRSPGPAAG